MFGYPRYVIKMPQELIQHVSAVHSGLSWNLAVFVFLEKGKLETLEKKPHGVRRAPNMTLGSIEWESVPSHTGGRQVLLPLCQFPAP